MTDATQANRAINLGAIEKPTRKSCGSCTLCCRLLPVPEIKKSGGVCCSHQTATGCAIYANRPMSCRLWSCRWLIGDSLGERPDVTHYVVDSALDHVLFNGESVTAVQVWVDPAYPDAHKAPALRDYLDKCGRMNAWVAIIRYNWRDGFVLVPPSMSGDTWHELGGQVVEREVMEAKTTEGTISQRLALAGYVHTRTANAESTGKHSVWRDGELIGEMDAKEAAEFLESLGA